MPMSASMVLLEQVDSEQSSTVPCLPLLSGGQL
jgi:hypothetical protein